MEGTMEYAVFIDNNDRQTCQRKCTKGDSAGTELWCPVSKDAIFISAITYWIVIDILHVINYCTRFYTWSSKSIHRNGKIKDECVKASIIVLLASYKRVLSYFER